MPTPLVTLHDVSLCLYGKDGKRTLFEHLDFSLYKGQHVALHGENGAGKSSFLRLLRGDIAATQGQVIWHVEGKAENSPLMGRTITSLVSTAQQEMYLQQAWQLSAMEILLTAFSDSTLLYGLPSVAQQEHAQHMAARLQCTHILHLTATALSQGQLRLLLLGRALLRRSPILLLDEYTDGLDSSVRAHVLKILDEESSHCTMLFTTHRPQSIPTWVYTNAHICDGKLSLTQDVVTQHTCCDVPSRFSAPPVPSTWDTLPHTPKETHTQPLLVIEHAHVYIDRTPVLHDICWTVHNGEHWRLCGGNGTGKSTLLRLLIADVHEAYGGRVERILPRHTGSYTPVTERALIRRAIRIVSDSEQACYAHTRERVHNIRGIELVLSGYDGTVGLYRTFCESEISYAHELMNNLGLTALAQCHIRTLSSGQLRRLFLARALIMHPFHKEHSSTLPDILLLDEPFSGLDATSRHHMFDILENISEHVHLILVSHHHEDCPSCMNRKAYMDQGRLYIL